MRPAPQGSVGPGPGAASPSSDAEDAEFRGDFEPLSLADLRAYRELFLTLDAELVARLSDQCARFTATLEAPQAPGHSNVPGLGFACDFGWIGENAGAVGAELERVCAESAGGTDFSLASEETRAALFPAGQPPAMRIAPPRSVRECIWASLAAGSWRTPVSPQSPAFSDVFRSDALFGEFEAIARCVHALLSAAWPEDARALNLPPRELEPPRPALPASWEQGRKDAPQCLAIIAHLLDVGIIRRENAGGPLTAVIEAGSGTGELSAVLAQIDRDPDNARLADEACAVYAARVAARAREGLLKTASSKARGGLGQAAGRPEKRPGRGAPAFRPQPEKYSPPPDFFPPVSRRHNRVFALVERMRGYRRCMDKYVRAAGEPVVRVVADLRGLDVDALLASLTPGPAYAGFCREYTQECEERSRAWAERAGALRSEALSALLRVREEGKGGAGEPADALHLAQALESLCPPPAGPPPPPLPEKPARPISGASGPFREAVVIGKHLCGSATDATLRAACRSPRVRGIGIALCCHAKGDAAAFVNLEGAAALGLSPALLQCMHRACSWALAFRGRPGGAEGAEGGAGGGAAPDGLQSRKAAVGRLCREALDLLRLDWLRRRGWEAGLRTYVSEALTPENLLLWAARRRN